MGALGYLRSFGLAAEALPGGGLWITPTELITDDVREWVRGQKVNLLTELAAQPATDKLGPTEPCSCGCQSWYLSQNATQWLCRECHPATMGEGYTIMVVAGPPETQ